MTTKIYIILGLPGAGKGVCAQALKKHKNFIHLSCGEYLRRQVRQRTALGISYQDDIDSGTKLLPCEVIWSIVKQEATQAIDNNNNIVIDGFPRTEKQLVFFKEFAVEKLITPKYIYFDVDEELAIKRLLTRQTCSECSHDYIMTKESKIVCDICRGKLLIRNTDNKETLLKRIKLFYQTTGKVLSILKQLQELICLDTNQDLDLLVENFLILQDKDFK